MAKHNRHEDSYLDTVDAGRPYNAQKHVDRQCKDSAASNKGGGSGKGLLSRAIDAAARLGR